jgi:hypothetical protein
MLIVGETVRLKLSQQDSLVHFVFFSKRQTNYIKIHTLGFQASMCQNAAKCYTEWSRDNWFEQSSLGGVGSSWGLFVSFA